MPEASERRPNLVVVLADQLRRSALGVYGDRNLSTPHIDALAASGVRFLNGCSTYPVCVPYRFSLMTGEYAHTRFIPAIEWRMSPAERTLADELNTAGYETAYFGKWHLYGGFGLLPGHTTVKASRTPIPRAYQGRWQVWRGFDICNDPFHSVYFEDGDPTPRPIEGYQTDGLFDLAVDYLQRGLDPNRPFCCVLSVEPPHPLFVAPETYMRRWRGRRLHLPANFRPSDRYRPRGPDSAGVLDDLRAYYAMIENLDDNVGRLMTALRATSLLDDTVVILLSDHGELLGCHGQIAKQHPYEESVGVPIIVRDPAAAGRGGATIAAPVGTEDLLPTMLGLLGLRPASPKPGADLTPLIRGERSGMDRDAILLEFVAEFRSYMPYFEETWRAVRTERYKYVVKGGAQGGRPWLCFDLVEDPCELHNLVGEATYEGLVRDLHRRLRDLLRTTGDHYVLAPALGEEGLNLWAEGSKEPVRPPSPGPITRNGAAGERR